VSVIGFIVGVGLATGASAQGVRPAAEAEQVRARQRIFMMEGVLEHAVQLGVDNLRRRVRTVMPDDALLQGGAPQVRGFRLEGYGVFFDVEVPALRRSLAWSLRTMNETGGAVARDLAAMRSLVQSIPDPRVRAEFELTLRRLQQQVGPVTPAAPVRADRGQAAAPGATVTAQSVIVPPVREALDTAQPHVPDPALVNDPSDAYTEEVKATMIDAMIEHSGALMLGDQEWLAVAARDNAPSGAFMPGDPDVVTLVLRVRGSDLNAFRAGRLTLEQVRARVEVGEF
jgi:hypothetical protein